MNIIKIRVEINEIENRKKRKINHFEDYLLFKVQLIRYVSN